jgi:hypothetical protein
MQVDIEFKDLITLVKNLPTGKLRQLKAEIEIQSSKEKRKVNLKTLLLNGPVATSKQLEVIENNRKALNQWRTK